MFILPSSLRVKHVNPGIYLYIIIILLLTIVTLLRPLVYESVHHTGLSSLERKNVAIVVPFIKSQKHRLITQFSLWNSVPPYQFQTLHSMDICDTLRPLANFTLVFYIDTFMDANLTQWVESELIKPLNNQMKCFRGGVLYLSANLKKDENFHPNGPCLMFYKLFPSLANLGFNYFFVVEPDVLPIRPFWLNALSLQLSFKIMDVKNRLLLDVKDDFWQKGSPSYCAANYSDISTRLDYHMNGNALYKLGDSEFTHYLNRVREYYPAINGVTAGCSTGGMYEGGHDHALYRFRMQSGNFEYTRSVMDKFRYSDFLINLCEDYYNATEIRMQFPKAFLIHSKGVFNK